MIRVGVRPVEQDIVRAAVAVHDAVTTQVPQTGGNVQREVDELGLAECGLGRG